MATTQSLLQWSFDMTANGTLSSAPYYYVSNHPGYGSSDSGDEPPPPSSYQLMWIDGNVYDGEYTYDEAYDIFRKMIDNRDLAADMVVPVLGEKPV